MKEQVKDFTVCHFPRAFFRNQFSLQSTGENLLRVDTPSIVSNLNNNVVALRDSGQFDSTLFVFAGFFSFFW